MTTMDELRRVHAAIRRDLAGCVARARQARAGADAGGVREAVRVLRSDGLGRRLRMNCLHQCAVVHTHHRVEDAVLFRRLRAAEPALGPTPDRLEADHRVVSDLLDRVEARDGLAGALDELSDHLLTHLDAEEAALEPVPARLER